MFYATARRSLHHIPPPGSVGTFRPWQKNFHLGRIWEGTLGLPRFLLSQRLHEGGRGSSYRPRGWSLRGPSSQRAPTPKNLHFILFSVLERHWPAPTREAQTLPRARSRRDQSVFCGPDWLEPAPPRPRRSSQPTIDHSSAERTEPLNRRRIAHVNLPFRISRQKHASWLVGIHPIAMYSDPSWGPSRGKPVAVQGDGGRPGHSDFVESAPV